MEISTSVSVSHLLYDNIFTNTSSKGAEVILRLPLLTACEFCCTVSVGYLSEWLSRLFSELPLCPLSMVLLQSPCLSSGCPVAVIKLHPLCDATFLDDIEGRTSPNFPSGSLHTDEAWSLGSDWFGKFWFILKSCVGNRT